MTKEGFDKVNDIQREIDSILNKLKDITCVYQNVKATNRKQDSTMLQYGIKGFQVTTESFLRFLESEIRSKTDLVGELNEEFKRL